MSGGPLYFLFFCSGVSGLVYQVIWVREFGNVFGNTVYSAALVVAIFMLGLGLGSYAIGAWADRRYLRARDSLLGTYGVVELVIGGLGFAVALILPSLGALAAAMSAYQSGAHGWFVLTPASYVARAAIAIVLLTPITTLMGGTLTLLIRHLVRQDVEAMGSWKIAALYGVNTAGAAAGAFLTDFTLVPAMGLFATELVAVGLNVVAGAGALMLARRARAAREAQPVKRPAKAGRRAATGRRQVPAVVTSVPIQVETRPVGLVSPDRSAVLLTSLALALSGFGAMGLEIVWVRHFTLLLGGFRAVFSLLMTVMLVGIGVGSFAGGAIARRTGRPAAALMVTQALLVAAALGGLAAPTLTAVMATGRALEPTLATLSPWRLALTEFWYNVRPMLLEAGLPAILMGCSYPLANAVIQHVEDGVGRRAGALYLANTAGAVLGSLTAGFVLLPTLGIQGSATWLLTAAGLAIVPLSLVGRRAATEAARRPARQPLPVAVAGVTAIAAMAVWVALPANYILQRSMLPQKPGQRLLEVSEGTNELIAVTELPGRGRVLMTNGHAMSSTAPLDQRYMRALAHIPLLLMDKPERVLVIGFGVGNSTQAATLHPSVRRVEVADLSEHVLEQASYFRDANHDVLSNPRVAVYVNDGRQHLEMQPPNTYDLVTLEPPPIAYAGVSALYSRDFYALVRSRLKPGGYISQWLPAYQVPAATTLAMVRAFVDVFPHAVLLSGMQAELLLVGTTAPSLQVDPERLVAELQREPEVEADLRRLDLGTPTEIVGSFVSAGPTLERATRGVAPATDDRPFQEYGVRSMLGTPLLGIPGSLFNLGEVGQWCPRCFQGDRPEPVVAELDSYLELLQEGYRARPADVEAAATAGGGTRRVLGSAYLGAVLPDSSTVHSLVGMVLLRDGETDAAIAELEVVLQREPESAAANRNLGEALASAGRPDALDYMRRAVQLDPNDADAQHDLGSALLEQREYAAAAEHLRVAVRAAPNSASAQNDLGVALASSGNIAEAIQHFSQAVTLNPDFPEARQNLAAALRVNGGRSR